MITICYLFSHLRESVFLLVSILWMNSRSKQYLLVWSNFHFLTKLMESEKPLFRQPWKFEFWKVNLQLATPQYRPTRMQGYYHRIHLELAQEQTKKVALIWKRRSKSMLSERRGRINTFWLTLASATHNEHAVIWLPEKANGGEKKRKRKRI